MNPGSPHFLKKGVFLIACPEIDEGIFYRSVILLCDHSKSGSFGLVVNKPLDNEVSGELTALDGIDQANIAFRAGGPMQPGQMMLLHASDEIPDQTLEVCPSVYLGGDVDFLHKQAATAGKGEMMLCFGFAGWTGGLLEKEVAGGMWFTCPATKDLLFAQDPKTLWQTLLRNMGGRYAALSMIPEDLSQN